MFHARNVVNGSVLEEGYNMLKKKWAKLLTHARLCIDEDGNFYSKEEDEKEHRPPFVRDYDRIIFSSAFRRLAKKTQVHPLASNDHIHNRLTHSLEVASVGRSLGAMVGEQLAQKNMLPDGFHSHQIGEIVQAACLAHDIGNPPFGHAGESALQNWFQNPQNSKYTEKLTATQRSDFENFDGNAQSFRIVTALEYYKNKGGMHLTYPTLATMVKYPITAYRSEEFGKTKFGFYESEKPIFLNMAKKLGLGEEINNIKRHPLSFLAEAADDICYNIIDLEDAQEMKILSVEDITTVLSPVIKNISFSNYDSPRRKVSYIRSKALSCLINDLVETFIDNIEELTCGTVKNDLIDMSSDRVKDTIKEAKKIAKDQIFKEARKITLEIGAYTIFEKLLDAFIPAVYERVYNPENINESFKTQRVIDLLGVNAPHKNSRLYDAFQSVVDFVSGMTDDYATFISSQFSGAGK